MKIRLLTDSEGVKGPLPAGTEIEHPDSFLLVEQGLAECVDKECITALDELHTGIRDDKPTSSDVEPVFTAPGAGAKTILAGVVIVMADDTTVP